MKITQICIGRFHHFHLARQMEMRGLLDSIYTGYPKYKLRDETGIPPDKIKSFPWLQTPYMALGKFGLDRWNWLNKEIAWLSQDYLDRYVANKINSPTILMALSASGLHTGRRVKSLGGFYICDRGSSHILFQNQILKEEYLFRGLKFKGIDLRIIDKEMSEYNEADIITVPSKFVWNSFIEKGIDKNKLRKLVFGSRLERFSKIGDIIPGRFRILWVGAISIRKGFMDLIRAFELFKHPQKELIVIGHMQPEIEKLLGNRVRENIYFKGTVPNSDLPMYYSTSNVFVLPSIEEGLANVLGEAMACGCPIIATPNSGAEDLVTDGEEGFIVPIRSPETIKDKFELLADNTEIWREMSLAAIRKTKSVGGWNTYGEQFFSIIKEHCSQ